MQPLLTLRDRSVYWLPLPRGTPAVYYLVDRDAGSVLINAPPYSSELQRDLSALAPTKYLFLPSYYGARDLDAWRQHRIETLAYGPEIDAIDGTVDIVLDNKSKLTRTIGFLPMSGRTRGSCALHLRNLPGAIFFGPILAPGDNGWPTLQPGPDDYSYESRIFGSLGLQDLRYDYAFTDVFVPGETPFGPGADRAIATELAAAFT